MRKKCGCDKSLQRACQRLCAPVVSCAAPPQNGDLATDNNNHAVIFGAAVKEALLSAKSCKPPIVDSAHVTEQAVIPCVQAPFDIERGLGPSDALAESMATQVNRLADATVRLCDAAAQFIEQLELKKHDGPKYDSLLRFRDWWALEEAHICVGGKVISGVPIFIEEGALRVIDHNHSYFIPLEKVDYIRTNDGLGVFEKI